MTPLPLTAARNRRTDFLLGVRRRIATINAVCDNPEVLKVVELTTVRRYANSHQEVLEMKLMRGVLEHHQKSCLPKEQTLSGSKPFATTGLGFMDGVKALVGERIEMRVYPLLLVCQSTGALHTQVAHDYSTTGFRIQWNQFVAEET